MLRRLFDAGPPLEALHQDYAKKGQIYADAPVKTRSEIYIKAPVEQVWAHLIDLASWPTYSPAFRNVRLDSAVAVDAAFQFTLYGFPIRAKFAAVHPGRKLAWTGKSLWFKAIDLHELERAADGGTRYSIAESFCGVLASMFMSGERLQKQHQQWQTAFKQAVERAA